MNDVKDTSATFDSKALRAFSIRERVEELLLPYLEEFTVTIPKLKMHKRTYGGAWVHGVRSTDEHGSPDYSRLEFELVIDSEERTVSVTVKGTTFNRDHEARSLVVNDDDAGLARLGDFFETAFLLYATRYFEAAPPGQR